MVKEDYKKVGIQTPHYASNYGAQLQAFALGAIIRNLGFNIEYIDRRPPYFYEYRNIVDKLLKELELRTRMKGFSEFEEKFLRPVSERIIHNEEYTKLDQSRYHAIVVGSDQIWRDDYYHSSFELSPYLYFLENNFVKRIAYAPSFGKNTCSHTKAIHDLIEAELHKFNSLSTREESGIKILKEVYHTSGSWVADPTLLHNSSFYDQELGIKRNKTYSNKLVTYILTNDYTKVSRLNLIAKLTGREVSHIYKPVGKLFRNRFVSFFLKFKKVPSVIDWLTQISSADYILTDSFHGMVFCILYKKQFVVINNVKGGSDRFTSLLNRLGLIDRLCEWSDSNNYIAQKLFTDIDYTHAYIKIEEFRTESINYLKEALQDESE